MFKPKVEINEWSGAGDSDSFSEIAKEILAPLLQNIYISVPHGNMSRLRNDDSFKIQIWSTAMLGEGAEKVDVPAKIYGVQVDCRDRGFGPSNSDKSIKVFYCPHSGYAVAELFENNNLFIHYDICHHGTRRELEIFKILLRNVFDWITIENYEIPTEKILKEIEEIQIDGSKNRELFVNALYSSDFDDATNKLLKSIDSDKKAVTTCQHALKEALAEKQRAFSVLEHTSMNEQKTIEIYEKEFDKLLSVPGVLGIDISDGKICVYTKMIRITYRDIVYRIGKFRIEIPTEGDVKGLKFFNLTNNGEGPGRTNPRGFDANSEFNRHHPHVKSSGHACLGNIGEAMMEYISSYQYSVVIILAIKFLETVEYDDSAGRGILWWPKETI